MEKVLDLEANKQGLENVLCGIQLSNRVAVEWLAKRKFEPYVCIFSRKIDWNILKNTKPLLFVWFVHSSKERNTLWESRSCCFTIASLLLSRSFSASTSLLILFKRKQNTQQTTTTLSVHLASPSHSPSISHSLFSKAPIHFFGNWWFSVPPEASAVAVWFCADLLPSAAFEALPRTLFDIELLALACSNQQCLERELCVFRPKMSQKSIPSSFLTLCFRSWINHIHLKLGRQNGVPFWVQQTCNTNHKCAEPNKKDGWELCQIAQAKGQRAQIVLVQRQVAKICQAGHAFRQTGQQIRGQRQLCDFLHVLFAQGVQTRLHVAVFETHATPSKSAIESVHGKAANQKTPLL